MRACSLLLLGLMVVYNQSFGETDSQKIERLEKQVALLSKQVFRASGPEVSFSATPSSTASSAGGVSSEDSPGSMMPSNVDSVSLEQQYRELLGRFEELEHQLNALKQQVDDLTSFMTHQAGKEQNSIQTGEEQNTQSAKEVCVVKEQKDDATSKVQKDSKTHLPDDPVQSQYDHALSTLRSGKYKEAIVALQDFLKKHADHELAANATYWLGESYFMEKKYDKAIGVFAQGYKAFSKGRKGADMLLKIGLCLEKQNKVKEACLTVEQLSFEHKMASEGVKQAARKLRQKLKCSS